MDSLKNLRIRTWSIVIGYTALIYSTLYIVRPVCEFLKKSTPFSLVVNGLCIALLIIVFFGIIVKVRLTKRSSYLFLLIILAAYVYGLSIVPNPEEKIHFIEYGLLAYLVYRAVRLDSRTSMCYLYSLIIVVTLGWIDEGIQHLLPNRYYQIEDVILNGVSGLLGLCMIGLIQMDRS